MKKLFLLFAIVFISFSSYSQFYKWVTLNSGITTGTLYDVKFVNDSLGFAVGNDGTTNYILKTADAGESWQNMANASVTQLVRGFDFIDENTLYVIGKKGGLFKTTDGGTTWALVNLGTNVDLVDISFPDKKAGYICTSAGRYIHYDGIGWSTKTVFAADNFIAVGFPAKDQGFLTASSGRVWRTLDGGSSWDTIKSITSPILGSHFMSANVGYIVGPKGFVQRTITGGLQWSDTLIYPDSFMDIDFRAVFFPFQNFGFIGGNNGIILKTSDGGSFWQVEPTQVSIKILRIHAPSLNSAFAVGENGTILRRQEAVGMNEMHEPMSRIYPNPAADYFQVSFKKSISLYSIRVFNLGGNLLPEKQLAGQEKLTIPTSGWAKGMYLVNVVSTNNNEWIKLIIN